MILVRRLPVMILAVLGVLLGHFPSMAEESRADINDPAALEAFLDGVISTQLKQYHIAGATVAVVKDGALLLAKGYGFADLEEGPVAVDPGRTLFRPGSVYKLITWTAVMQLVEKGQLDLDTDINCYLDFSIPARLLNQGGNEPPRPITLADLMAHTAGFEEVALGVFVRSAKEVLPLGEYLKEFLPERVYPPGELGAYSNYGAALAGDIVERVSGMPFAGYVEKNIFAPLGMEHSTFRQPLPAALAGQMARGYNYVDGVYCRESNIFSLIQPGA